MNVIIIDDHPITALGVEQILLKDFKNAKIVMAADGSMALETLKTTLFDLCILDVMLPSTDTHALLHSIIQIQPKCKVLIYSNSPDDVYAMNYVSLGASGYINKIATSEELITAIKLVLAGQVYLSEKVLRSSLGANKRTDGLGNPRQSLSKRELEMFNHLLQGQSSKEICVILNIEQSTAATIKSRLMKKLGAQNMVDLLRIAEEYGLR